MSNDKAYDNGGFIPGAAAYPDRWADDAREFREVEAALGRARLNAAYGPHEREKLDIFHPAGRAEGLVVFVHGGYWSKFDRSYWSHLARGATQRGWAVAMPSYPLCPEVRIADITRSVAAAIGAAASYISGPIALTGHSAGGHLVARMACADAGLAPDLAARIRHIAPISHLTDLRPLIDTAMNDHFRMDDAAARAESPALMEKVLDVPVSCWVGADERPAFLDQARWLGDAWPSTTLQVFPGRHHFDIIEPLADPESALVGTIIG
jgi:arylformamidase